MMTFLMMVVFNQHFLNQIIRIPTEVKAPNAKKVLQLILNIGQGIITNEWKL